MEFELTDREKILMTIISKLSTTQLLGPGGRFCHDSKAFGDYVHFAYGEKPKKGDLVIGKTGRNGRWKIGIYQEPLLGGWGGAVIGEISTGKLCNYGNEEFVPIVGLTDSDLRCGIQREMEAKVVAAFQRGDEFNYRYGGIKFDGDEIEITIREAFNGFGDGSIPFSVRMKYNKRTSVKAILKAMRDGGYGTREFERPEKSDLPAAPKEAGRVIAIAMHT